MPKEKHICQALVLCCIDFRFHQKFFRYMKKDLGIESFDILALAGGAKNISRPEKECFRDIVLRNIEISVKLHGIKKVVLTNHIDCGAYGGSGNFKNEKQEIDFHKKELAGARKVVREKFPDLDIETYIIREKDIKGFVFLKSKCQNPNFKSSPKSKIQKV